VVIDKKYNQPKIHFEPKGWGFEKWIVNTELYCGKVLYFAKNRKCSLHYHKDKDETFYIQSGRMLLYYSDDIEMVKKLLKETVSGRTYKDFLDTIILEKGDNFYIPPGRIHQMVALQDTELIEFSTKHEEEDSYRLVKGD
jgi:mannose-6-phosphate isomerase-like protein (cupin superfamily)